MKSESENSLSEVHSSVDIHQNKKPWKKLLAFIGPAYLVSVGYMDPGNWATDIAGGSQFGYKLLWVLLMSNLMALLLQSLSARLGIVRGLDLAQASRSTYPKIINIPLYFLAEIAIAACDLAEIIGMAIGLNLLFGLPLIYGVIISAFDTLLIMLLLHRGIRVMEGFIVSMVFIIGVSFLVEMFITGPDLAEVAKGLVPSSLGNGALYIAIGILGATVMPHNLYLHSSLVQTRKIERTDKGLKEAIKFNFFDTTIALNLAFFVNAAILILAASAFHKNGLFEVAEIQDAHKLLSSLFGDLAPALFAIALIASGQSSTITGTLAGQIVMEGYLNLRIRPWLRRLITRLIAITPAIFTILYFGEERLGELLVLSQVILSLQLGFAVIPMIHFCSDKAKMGKFAISKPIKILAWLTASIIVLLNAKLVVDEIRSWLTTMENPLIIYVLVIPVALALAILLLYLTLKPFFGKQERKVAFTPHEVGEVLPDLVNKIYYKNIALTLDFGDSDLNSIKYAVAQGGKEAQYILIHITESAGAIYHGNKSRDQETLEDEQILANYVDELKQQGISSIGKIGFGNPAKAISKIVNESEADLLVMGAHGHRNLKDIVFGSTLDSVRHRVQIPVLIVPKNPD